jgi:hypothetical protein
MGLYDYKVSQELVSKDIPFYALIMAAMTKADPDNVQALTQAFPKVWDELFKRYHAPGGVLSEKEEDEYE